MKAFLLFLLCHPLFLFSLVNVSQEKLWKKINNPPPQWMLDQISEDLSEFQESGITQQMLDNTMRNIYKVFTGRDAQLVRYKIRNNKISFSSLSEDPKDARIAHFMDFVDTMGRYIDLPDIDFVLSIWDSFDRPVFIEKAECPVFTMCKQKPNRKAALFPETRNMRNRERIYKEICASFAKSSWEEKIPKAFWRGGTTGMYYHPNEWDYKPRPRLTLFSIDHPDLCDARFTYAWWIDQQMQKLFESYGFWAPWIGPIHWIGHKYLIAVDGNTFPSSFWWELLSNCVVVKSDSEYVEWFYKGVQPYVHYVPYNPDCSDLAEKILWLQQNDEEARRIADNAAQFGKENLSTEDMMLYMYLLFNAYADLLRD